jgi:hypothetical protein
MRIVVSVDGLAQAENESVALYTAHALASRAPSLRRSRDDRMRLLCSQLSVYKSILFTSA